MNCDIILCLLGTTPDSTSVLLVCVGTHFRHVPITAASMTTSSHTATGWLDKFAICVHTRGTCKSLHRHDVCHTVEDGFDGVEHPWTHLSLVGKTCKICSNSGSGRDMKFATWLKGVSATESFALFGSLGCRKTGCTPAAKTRGRGQTPTQ